MNATVTTTGGEITGVYVPSGAYAFLGIRYGEPTWGVRRFRPPAPARPASGVVLADQYGPACPPTLTAEDKIAARQSPWWRTYGGFGPSTVYSEDCLRLNVWTPEPGSDRRLPVLVWLHGGGFSWGSAASVLTEGDMLASRHGAVVVSVNHRLGVLGFLHVGGVAPGWAESGVAGMLDIRLALEWVRDNVTAFGGDPNNVTLVGHSGGGAKVACLLAMPSAQGLFHQAVIQSGVVSLRALDSDEGEATARKLLAAVGEAPDNVAGLQRLPAAVLTNAASGLRFRPVVDSEVLPVHPFDPVAAPTAASVPLLIGTTAHDTAAFKSFDAHPDLTGITDAELRRLVAAHPAAAMGEKAEHVIDSFAAWYPAADRAELLVHITTALLRDRTRQLVERKLLGGPAQVYVYEFRYTAPMPPGTAFADRSMSAHGLEIPFVFDIAERTSLTGVREARSRLARTMSSAWVTFARTGELSAVPELPEWPSYDPQRRATMVLDAEPKMVTDPYAEQRRFFARLRERIDVH